MNIKKISIGVFMMIFFTMTILVGCGKDRAELIEAQRIVIKSDDKEIVLKNDKVKEFIDVLDVESWIITDSASTNTADVLAEADLYSYSTKTLMKDSTEEKVGRIVFYHNNRALLEVGLIEIYFEVSNIAISEVQDYLFSDRK